MHGTPFKLFTSIIFYITVAFNVLTIFAFDYLMLASKLYLF